MKHEDIVKKLTDYLCETNPVAKLRSPLPLDQSLVELGIMDSFGIIELVVFIEQNFDIKIHDSELTKEKFGGLNKMAKLIGEKLQTK